MRVKASACGESSRRCAAKVRAGPAHSRTVACELRAFKVGLKAPRSRGDRAEPFGGAGASWKGCFVGGAYLVQAVTQGPAGERLYGNFAEYTLLPAQR